MSDLVTRRLSITGLVQGVGYRWATVAEAQRLGVAGWVRNRLDGSVEAVVQGRPEAVRSLIEWAHRGPPGAVVSRVMVDEWNGPIEPGFQQIPTI